MAAIIHRFGVISPIPKILQCYAFGTFTRTIADYGIFHVIKTLSGIGGKKVKIYSLLGSGLVSAYRSGASPNALNTGPLAIALVAFDPLRNEIGRWYGPITTPFIIENVDILIITAGIPAGSDASTTNPVYGQYYVGVTCYYAIVG
jgi:hypothetical protein